MIVDAHVHLMEPERGAESYDYLRTTGGAWGQVWDANRLVELLDECGFDKAVVFTFAGLYANEEYVLYNDNLAQEVSRFPDRLIGFGCLDLKSDAHAADKIPGMVEELGLAGLKFHPWAQRFPANSGLLRPVYEQASRYHLPILFHTGTPPYSQPAQVAQWAGDYPEVQFIMGHFGKLIWLDAVRAAIEHPNVYLESSGAQVSDIEIAVELLGEDRIVFGTDLPIGGAAAGKWNVDKIRSARISEKARERILSQNILDILDRITEGWRVQAVIIDAHVHIGTTIRHFRTIEVTADDILRDMDANGIDMAVLCPSGADLAVHNRHGNDLVAAAVRSHPDRFIGLGTANPWYGEAALEELDRVVVGLGLRGFKFHSLIQGFHLNDPTLVYPVVEKAIELDVPVDFHCGTPIMAMPYKIQDLARQYPEAELIMGHRGWDFHFDAICVERNCHTLWIETSKCEYVNLEHSYQMGNSHRMLYGSDYPTSSMASELSKVRRLVGLTGEDRSSILGGNCLRLFGMQQRA